MDEIFSMLLHRKLGTIDTKEAELVGSGTYFYGPENKMNRLMEMSANVLRNDMNEIRRSYSRCDKRR